MRTGGNHTPAAKGKQRGRGPTQPSKHLERGGKPHHRTSPDPPPPQPNGEGSSLASPSLSRRGGHLLKPEGKRANAWRETQTGRQGAHPDGTRGGG